MKATKPDDNGYILYVDGDESGARNPECGGLLIKSAKVEAFLSSFAISKTN